VVLGNFIDISQEISAGIAQARLTQGRVKRIRMHVSNGIVSVLDSTVSVNFRKAADFEG
jgi:hypothetical protein